MSVIAANSHVLCRELKHHRDNLQPYSSSGQSFFWPKSSSSSSSSYSSSSGFWVDFRSRDSSKKKTTARRDSFKTLAFWPDLSKPTVLEMEPINDCDHLDQILSHAKEISQPIIIDWMASWCRKCIYLKPKLEKLAAEYDSKVKFYCVDVNKVPQTLVKRGNISKMPTIQIWKDGEMKEEVIGGHKAWIVINEVTEMIKKYV